LELKKKMVAEWRASTAAAVAEEKINKNADLEVLVLQLKFTNLQPIAHLTQHTHEKIFSSNQKPLNKHSPV
jgi:hypothetical protein